MYALGLLYAVNHRTILPKTSSPLAKSTKRPNHKLSSDPRGEGGGGGGEMERGGRGKREREGKRGN